ncbi:MAG: LapA family protein [Candidatus Pacebacteria bacterium]|nr:LapA family protein [Candidatus Paceibacterota bacterium]
MILSLFVGFILGGAALLFALQNTQTAALTFMGWQFESSLAVLIIVAIIAGILISILATLPSAVNASFKIMSLKKENKRLVSEIEDQQQAKRNAQIHSERADATTIDLRN